MTKFDIRKILLLILLLPLFFSCKKQVVEEKKIDASAVKSIPFLNNNEIRYYEKIYYKSLGNCNDKQDCAKIKVEYPEIISSGAPFDSINQFLQNQILSLFLNEDNSIPQTLDEIADSLFASYIQLQKDFKDYHTGWFIKSKITINGVTKNILTVKTEEIIFTGGANVNYNVEFTNFDLSDGNRILLDEIVSDENLQKLNSIGKTIFYKLKELSSDKSLKDAGYWFENEKFELNDNFAVADSGLIFFYNYYEIAPRSNGTTELFIPKEKLFDIVSLYKK